MPTTSALTRLAYRGLVIACIGLGAAGAILPLLPTTPFLLVAAWAAPKGSPRLAEWLWQHPWLGPPLQDWRTQGAVPARAKLLTCGLLVVSWCLLWLGGAPTWLLIAIAGLFLSIALFLITRPTARRSC